MSEVPAVEQHSDRYRLIDTILTARHHIELATFLAEERAKNHSLTEIAFQLRTMTGVSVSHEAIRRWISDGHAGKETEEKP